MGSFFILGMNKGKIFNFPLYKKRSSKYRLLHLYPKVANTILDFNCYDKEHNES